MTGAGPASAASSPDPLAAHMARSAGQKWALVSKETGGYVKSELSYGDDQWAKLRAVSGSVGSWERFTLHTSDKGASIALRNEANGRFVSAEIEDSGTHNGQLRARGDRIGSWESFTLVEQPDGWLALKSVANGKFVAVEGGDGGSDENMLRARSASVAGDWEKFKLVPQPTAGNHAVPAPSPSSKTSAKVMQWNVCGNTNADCGNYRKTPYDTALSLLGQMNNTMGAGYTPDAVLLQEICEKQTKEIEVALEARNGAGWDVRFAPIYHRVGTSGYLAQKECAADVQGNARGAYGVAIAVGDSNTVYRNLILPSPAGQFEQRAAICAYMPTHAAAYCSAHFSAPGDDPLNVWRPEQASEYRATADGITAQGYAPVFGGDLNATPESGLVSAVHDGYGECWSAADTTGERETFVTADKREKIDYIFGPAGHTACTVSADNSFSDHRSVHSLTMLN